MFTRMVSLSASSIVLCTFTGFAAAQTPSARPAGRLEGRQTAMEVLAAKDSSWIDTLTHANLKTWETGAQCRATRHR